MRNHPITFHIRFTEQEYERLCKYSAKAGLPKSTYIRHMINGSQPREKPPVDYYEFMRKIYELGNSLDRLTGAAHALGWVESEQLQAAIGEHANLVLQITDAMIAPEKVENDFLRK